MQHIAVEIVGWVGALLVLCAYLLLSLKTISSDSYGYHAMNILGSFLLGVYAVCKHASASMIVNAVWMGIGVSAMVLIYRTQKLKRNNN